MVYHPYTSSLYIIPSEVGNTFLRNSFWVLPGCPLELAWMALDVEHHGMVVDVSLLLWILWLGGCCQVPASQAAVVMVPCVLEAVRGQAALSRLQGWAICEGFLVEIVKNVFQDLKVLRCCPRCWSSALHCNWWQLCRVLLSLKSSYNAWLFLLYPNKLPM